MSPFITFDCDNFGKFFFALLFSEFWAIIRARTNHLINIIRSIISKSWNFGSKNRTRFQLFLFKWLLWGILLNFWWCFWILKQFNLHTFLHFWSRSFRKQLLHICLWRLTSKNRPKSIFYLLRIIVLVSARTRSMRWCLFLMVYCKSFRFPPIGISHPQSQACYIVSTRSNNPRRYVLVLNIGCSITPPNPLMFLLYTIDCRWIFRQMILMECEVRCSWFVWARPWWLINVMIESLLFGAERNCSFGLLWLIVWILVIVVNGFILIENRHVSFHPSYK